MERLMRNTYRYSRYYRHPHTTQEKKANQDTRYTRGRRFPKNLPDVYDDIPIKHTKCWKDHRKTQYRLNSQRGRKNVVFLHSKTYNVYSRTVWKLEEYFKIHDIPHNIKKKYNRKKIVQTYYWKNQLTHYNKIFDEIDSEGWYPIYKSVKVKLDKPHVYYTKEFVGFEVTWWSDKDIGIFFLL